MTEQSRRVASESVMQLASSLRAAAEKLGLSVNDLTDIVGNFFLGEEALNSSKLDPSDLPSVKRGVRIGRYTVVLGILPDEPNPLAVRETLRRYRNQCVIARSFLSANEALDLQLMLIGPRGSDRVAEWRAVALMIERDDRVARKFAWLRPEEEVNDAASFSDFLKRTFLARPWDSGRKFPAGGLDRLNVVEEGTVSSVPRNTAEEWEAIALNTDADPMKMVDALIDAWKRRITE